MSVRSTLMHGNILSVLGEIYSNISHAKNENMTVVFLEYIN